MLAAGRAVRAVIACIAATAIVGLSGCGGGAKTPPAARPSTSAHLQIVKPVANEETGPDVTVVLSLEGGQVVQQSTGPLAGDRGHVHVSVDGKLVSMAYGLTQDVKSLSPGMHTLTAEFVAVDHAPFSNRALTAVIFDVKAS